MLEPAYEPMTNQELVTRFLHGRVVRCPACSYPLTDLPAGICPECGLALELRLMLTRPRQKIYLAGIVGISTGIGIAGCLLAYFFWMLVFRKATLGSPIKIFTPLLVGLAVTVPALMVWIRSWVYFQRNRAIAGLILVVVCWVVALSIPIWLFGWNS